jgi:hypothetical protein
VDLRSISSIARWRTKADQRSDQKADDTSEQQPGNDELEPEQVRNEQAWVATGSKLSISFRLQRCHSSYVAHPRAAPGLPRVRHQPDPASARIAMHVALVVFGPGKRYFGSFDAQALLEDCDVVIEGRRVLHPRYRVRRSSKLKGTAG